MKGRYLAIILSLVVLVGGGLACGMGGTPEPTPTPPPTYTPEPTYTSAPTLTPVLQPSDTPVPEDAPTRLPPATEDISADLELILFDDPAGVFELSYPAGLDRIEKDEESGDYGYTFTSTDEDVVLMVSASVLSDQPFSDAEWNDVAASVGDELGTELDRVEGGPGDHFLYLEGVSQEEGLHSVMWVEESQGSMMIFVAMATTDQWPAWESTLEESLDQFMWSSDAVRGTGTSGAEDVIVQPPDAAVEFVHFEDPNGVFNLDYPAHLTAVEQEDTTNGYSYTFSTPDGDTGIMVVFSVRSDLPFTDAEWQQELESFAGMLDPIDTRQEGGSGKHFAYLEGKSSDDDMYDAIWLEESEGVLMALLGVSPVGQWPQWEGSFSDALDSFIWSAPAAQQFSGSETPTVVEPPTPVPQPTQTPVPEPVSDLPPGKGAVVMFNCLGDVVTVDVIPDGIFQELAPGTADGCTPGEPIILDPGEHLLRASIAGVPSQGEAPITIVEGQYLQFTWR